ncbi:hypothetical protein SRHO_G00100330 [Serrasalmus rhombeus]
MESEYGDVLYFTEVRWLSRGNILKRFFELRAEVKAFMGKDGVAVPMLSDPKWLMDFAFLVDITHELNVLNKKLQGQGQLVSAAYDSVRAFSAKLMLWKAQLSQTNLCHFPACKALMDAGTPFSGEKYVDAILMLQEEFDHRFADFKTHRAAFQIFADPFSFDVQDAPPCFKWSSLTCSATLNSEPSSGSIFAQIARANYSYSRPTLLDINIHCTNIVFTHQFDSNQLPPELIRTPGPSESLLPTGSARRRRRQRKQRGTEKEGNTVALKCGRLTKGPVTWSRDTNGQRVDILTTHNGETTKHIADPDGRYDSRKDLVLIIYGVSQSDAGRYDCSGATVELSVTSGTDTLHQTEKEGNTVALKCGRLTKGPVTWSRDTNGQRVDILTTHNGETTKHIADPDGRYGSRKDPVLIIYGVSQSDAGRYDCYAVKHNQEHVYDSIDDTMPTAQPVSDQQRTEEPIYYLATDPGAQTTDNQQSAYEAIDPPEEHATPQERVDQLCGLIKKPTK